MTVVDMLNHGENYSGAVEDFPDVKDELWQEKFLADAEGLEVGKIYWRKHIECFYVVYGKDGKRGPMMPFYQCVFEKSEVMKKVREQGENHIFTPKRKEINYFSHFHFIVFPKGLRKSVYEEICPRWL